VRIGLTVDRDSKQESLRQVARRLHDALAERNELIYSPSEAAYQAGESYPAIAADFVRSCDVIVGHVSDVVLEARRQLRSDVPCILHLLGGLPRGAFGWRSLFPLMTTGDVLVANSTADVALAAQFLRNAQVHLVPFAFDDRVYYPLADAERIAIRHALGLREEDRLLLYAGRITAEKNIHTVLRVFSAVLHLIPDAHLLIVGPIDKIPFTEFGVVPLNISNTLRKVAAKLGLHDGRVHMAGLTDAPRLRELYNVADAVINLTLNHDENFGLAQVEAMACGTPVIGTAWGGLKDTIVDGVTGYQVSTLPTASGVKVNWWEAVNRAVLLLDDATARARFRKSCREHVIGRYSPAAYRAGMEAAIAAGLASAGGNVEPLQVTEWATEFWSVCDPAASERPPYRRGTRSTELYRQLIVHYTGTSTASVATDAIIAADDVLCLSTPIVTDTRGRLDFDDLLYPVELDVPDVHRAVAQLVLAAMRREPVTTVERLMRGHLQGVDAPFGALAWLLDAGVLLRTRAMPAWVAPQRIDARLGKPLFSFLEVDRTATDAVISIHSRRGGLEHCQDDRRDDDRASGPVADPQALGTQEDLRLGAPTRRFCAI
jgi:glycosyltransferase involved in cell wall biosynthesis